MLGIVANIISFRCADQLPATKLMEWRLTAVPLQPQTLRISEFEWIGWTPGLSVDQGNAVSNLMAALREDSLPPAVQCAREYVIACLRLEQYKHDNNAEYEKYKPLIEETAAKPLPYLSDAH
jgi:hypothetical protein